MFSFSHSCLFVCLLVFIENRVDTDIDGFIDYGELKTMMEKRGEPLTHLELTKLIKEVDEDEDGKLCFREVRRAKGIDEVCKLSKLTALNYLSKIPRLFLFVFVLFLFVCLFVEQIFSECINQLCTKPQFSQISCPGTLTLESGTGMCRDHDPPLFFRPVGAS